MNCVCLCVCVYPPLSPPNRAGSANPPKVGCDGDVRWSGWARKLLAYLHTDLHLHCNSAPCPRTWRLHAWTWTYLFISLFYLPVAAIAPPFKLVFLCLSSLSLCFSLNMLLVFGHLNLPLRGINEGFNSTQSFFPLKEIFSLPLLLVGGRGGGGLGLGFCWAPTDSLDYIRHSINKVKLISNTKQTSFKFLLRRSRQKQQWGCTSELKCSRTASMWVFFGRNSPWIPNDCFFSPLGRETPIEEPRDNWTVKKVNKIK